MKLKRILAMAAVVFLAALYVVSLVLAFIHSEAATRMLQLTIVLTVLIPIVAYIMMMFYKLNHKNDEKDHMEK